MFILIYNGRDVRFTTISYFNLQTYKLQGLM